MHIAEKIRGALSRSFLIDGLTLQVSCSIGVALYPDNAASVSELMRSADQAMYRAKKGGRDQVLLHSRCRST